MTLPPSTKPRRQSASGLVFLLLLAGVSCRQTQNATEGTSPTDPTATSPTDPTATSPTAPMATSPTDPTAQGEVFLHQAAHRSILVKRFPNGLYRSNCYVISVGSDGFVIDAGSNDEGIRRYIAQRKLTVRHIFATHGHIDHLVYGALVREWTGAPLSLHEADINRFNRDPPERIAGRLSSGQLSPNDLLALQRYAQLRPDNALRGGEHFDIQGVRIAILHTPGHSPGSVCVRVGDELLFTGDTLFARGVGRTDLDGGSHLQLANSLTNILFPLPDEVIIYPGHGPASPLRKAREFAARFVDD